MHRKSGDGVGLLLELRQYPVDRERSVIHGDLPHSAESSWARAVAQPPSRKGCTFTQTRSCHSLNSSVPGRPGIRRCQWWLPVRPASSRSLRTTRPRRRHSSRTCPAVSLRLSSSTGGLIVDLDTWGSACLHQSGGELVFEPQIELEAAHR